MAESDTDRSDPRLIVSTQWLADHLSAPDVKVLDASWHMPDTGRDAKAEFRAAHIPGAQFFDIDDIADTRSDLPHMAPPPEKFVSRVRPARHRRRASGGGLRPGRPVLGSPRLVDVPPVRAPGRGGAGRRPAEMARRGARDRGHDHGAARPPLHRAPRRLADPRRDADGLRGQARRRADPRRPLARPLPRRGARSRAPACAPATSPAR